MIRNSLYGPIFVILAGVVLSGCSANKGECRGSLASGTPNGMGGQCVVEQPVAIPAPIPEPHAKTLFRCAATLLDASGNGVNSAFADQLLSLKVEATGGTAPYSIPSLISSFASTTSISGSYVNSGTTDRTVEKRVEVRDSISAIATCSFSVIVKPAGTTVSPGANLACEIQVNPASPRTGTVTALKVKVTNGRGATSFRQLYPQLGWNTPEWTVAVTRISDTEGEVIGGIQYANVGDRIVSASVENNFQVAICSKRISVVNPGLQVTSTVAGSSTQVANIGSEFLLKAFVSGMTGTISYQFMTSEPNITITPNHTITMNGDTVTVRATDSTYHDFKVNVRATSTNGETTSSDIQLKFTSGVSLACRLELTNTPIVNSPVTIRAIAVNSLDSLEITQVTAINFSMRPFLNANPFSLTFPFAGTQLVLVRARSASTGVPCNLDTSLSILFSVMERQLTCDVSSGPNSSAASGTVSKIQVTMPRGAGSGPFELVEVRSTLAETSLYNSDTSALWQRVSFRRPGSHTVTARVRDRVDGRVAECSSIHIARRADAFAAGADKYSPPRVSVFAGANATLSRSFLAFDSSFTGGVRVAMGDVDGDGSTELIAGGGYNPGSAFGPRIRVFHGADLNVLRDFQPFSGVSMRDVYVAAGDVDGDGKSEIVAGSGCSAGQPRVRIFNGVTNSLTHEFFPYGSSGTGSRVAVGDVNGDGYADIVTAPCSGSDIHIYSGRDFSLVRSITAYPSSNRESHIAVGDVNGDGYADIVTGGNGTSGDREFTKVFDGRNGIQILSIAPFPSFAYDSRVAVGDANGDGIAEILIAAGGHVPGYPEIKTFSGQSGLTVPCAAGNFRPFGTAIYGNIFIAAGVGGL